MTPPRKANNKKLCPSIAGGGHSHWGLSMTSEKQTGIDEGLAILGGLVESVDHIARGIRQGAYLANVRRRAQAESVTPEEIMKCDKQAAQVAVEQQKPLEVRWNELLERYKRDDPQKYKWLFAYNLRAQGRRWKDVMIKLEISEKTARNYVDRGAEIARMEGF